MDRCIRLAAPALVAGGLFLAGCTSTPGGDPDIDSQPTDLAPYLNQEVDWRECPGSDEFLQEIPAQAQCATATVPVDYFIGSSGRGDLEIALIRIPADGPSQGSLLVNPGGPGASGFDHVASNAAALHDRLPGYDVVGFDPRGVSRSAGFECEQGTTARRNLIELDFTPEDQSELDENYEINDAYEAACRDANAAWGFLGTPSVARDVYVIARALGDEAVNFYGVSYGSVIGYELLRTYPDEIGRMILESPVDPSVEEMLADQLAAFNSKIEDLLELCATPAYSSCGNGRTAQEVRADFIAAGENIEDPSFRTITDDGHPSEALVYYGMILPLYLERNDEYTKLYLDAVASLINRRDAGNFEYWGYLYNSFDPTERTFSQTDDIQGVVTCLDESTAAADTDIAAERRKDEAEIGNVAERAPLLYAVGFSGAFLDDDRLYLPCSYAAEAFADPSIPDPLPAAAAVANPGAVPVLVLGITGDTATPYAWSQAVAAALGVPLVSQDTTGHGVYVDSDNACTRDIVTAYLASASLPGEAVTC